MKTFNRTLTYARVNVSLYLRYAGKGVMYLCGIFAVACMAGMWIFGAEFFDQFCLTFVVMFLALWFLHEQIGE